MKNVNNSMKTQSQECQVSCHFTMINSGRKINMITTSNILLIKAIDNYTSLILSDSTEHITSDSLQSLEQQLPFYFYRISRNTVLNTNYVKSIRKKDSKRIVELVTGEFLEISRRRVSSFITHLRLNINHL